MNNSKSIKDLEAELLQSFTDTVSSLSNDMQLLSSLSYLMNSGQILKEMDDQLSNLEGKVSMLQDVISEEELALDALEEMITLVKLQGQKIDNIEQRSKKLGDSSSEHDYDQSFIEDYDNDNDNDKQDVTITSNNDDDDDDNNKKVPEDHRSVLPEEEAISDKTSSSSVVSNNDNSMHHPIHISLVTNNELSSIPKSARGRVNLSMLNDALAEIIQICRDKYSILKDKKHHLHRQYMTAHLELDHHSSDTTVTTSDGEKSYSYYWVSEVALRDKCAFFQIGESTARNILSILRSLGRLKQVAGSRVTYKLLVNPSSSE